MKAVGFIPLRKGSKGIRGKNKRKMLGRPLFSWILAEAVFSRLDEIIVFTDDEYILDFVEQEYTWTTKLKAIKRSEKNAGDAASTEAAILEYCEINNYNFDVFCLLQATSPFTRAMHINDCLEQLNQGFDSALSVVRTDRFIWNEEGEALNYDYKDRPRRQDFKGLLVENGAIYCTTRKSLKESQNRISGKIATVEMPANSYVEIDSESDWKMAENLLASQLIAKKGNARITHLFLDVDGVFTDGNVLFSESGELAKSFDMRDGMGLEILRQHHIEVRVMTSEKSPLVAARMKKLKIDKVYLGVKDKFGFLQNIMLRENIKSANLAYIGDDVNDMANMCLVGWSFAPANAMAEIRNIADVNLSMASGKGAIREACNFLMKYNKRFENE